MGGAGYRLGRTKLKICTLVNNCWIARYHRTGTYTVKSVSLPEPGLKSGTGGGGGGGGSFLGNLEGICMPGPHAALHLMAPGGSYKSCTSLVGCIQQYSCSDGGPRIPWL